MIDPVSMYMVGGSKMAGAGLEAAYLTPVNPDERRQKNTQQNAGQNEKEAGNGVVVSISEEARSQARMSQMMAADPSVVASEGTQVQNQDDNNVKETPAYLSEEAQDQNQNQNLLRSEAQYQAAGSMAMASRSLLGNRPVEEAQPLEAMQNSVGAIAGNAEQNSAAIPPDALQASASTEGSDGVLPAASEQSTSSTVAQATQQNNGAGSSNNNRSVEYLSRTPFSYVSQTYQGMTSRMEPYMSSFMLGA